jgi:hypothetical protein
MLWLTNFVIEWHTTALAIVAVEFPLRRLRVQAFRMERTKQEDNINNEHICYLF